MPAWKFSIPIMLLAPPGLVMLVARLERLPSVVTKCCAGCGGRSEVTLGAEYGCAMVWETKERDCLGA